MSSDEITILKESVADIKGAVETISTTVVKQGTLLAERNSVAVRNTKLLVGLVIAVVLQIGSGLMGTGQRVQMIDDLKTSVAALTNRFEDKVKSDEDFKNAVYQHMGSLRDRDYYNGKQN